MSRPLYSQLLDRGFRFELVENRDPPDSGERIQKLGDFQFATSQHGLAVAEQQHVKVVIEQFEQRSFKLREIIEFGLRAGELLLNSSSERICVAQTSQK